MESFNKIDNESVLPESEANLDEHVERETPRQNVEEHNSDKIEKSFEKEKLIPATPKKTIKSKKGASPDEFKYQELDLSWYGRHVVGFKTVFNEYLEDLEIYTIKVRLALIFLSINSPIFYVGHFNDILQ